MTSPVLVYQRPIYLEQRGAPLWMKIVFLGLTLPYLLAISFVFRQLVSSPLRPETIAQSAGILMIGGVASFLWGNRIVLRVDSDGLWLLGYLWRFRYSREVIRISEIEDMVVACNGPMHTGFGVVKFNWFGQGVQLSVGSRKYNIGSSNPEALMRAIRSVPSVGKMV